MKNAVAGAAMKTGAAAMSDARQVRSSSPVLTGMLPYDPKYKKSDVLLSANESPLNVPDEVLDGVLRRVRGLSFNRYPDPMANTLRRLIAEWHGVKAGNVIVGNGGDELLFDLVAAWGGPGRKMLNFPPTFSVYETNAALTSTQVVNLPRNDDWSIDVDRAVAVLGKGDIDIVVITNPNNPTGTLTPLDDVRRILDASDALVLVDEAYGEFSRMTCAGLLDEYENLVILHTFSKAYRCAGVRLGYLLASPAVVAELTKVRQPYSVDAMSQIVGEEVVEHRDLFEDGIASTRDERDVMIASLSQMDRVTVYPSEANFVMFKIPFAIRVWEKLDKEHGVLVRNVSGERGLAGCLRATVGTAQENAAFLKALEEEMDDIAYKR